MGAVLIACAFALAGIVPACAADAMETFDETILRSYSILQCHPAQSEADRAYLAKVDAVKKAALAQLWAQFDKANPSRHEENGKAAQTTLDRRSEAHQRFIESQATEYGCDWLDGKVFQSQ